MTHYHELIEREAPLTVAIDTLVYDAPERFRCRTMRRHMPLGSHMVAARTEDVASIRGLVRAVRILRGADQ